MTERREKERRSGPTPWWLISVMSRDRRVSERRKTVQVLAAVALLLLMALSAQAQIPSSPPPPTSPVEVIPPVETPTPALVVPAPPVGDVVLLDPLAAGTGAEGWVWAMRYWAPPAEPRDLAGGRIQAQLGVGRTGIAFRGDVSGMPGEFSPDKPETFRSLEAHLAVHHNVAGAQGVKLGVAVGVGAGFSLETKEGTTPTTPHSATLGAGLHVSGRGWWTYAMYGQHQALPGSAAVVVYQIRASDRTATVGTFAVGSRGSYLAQFGIAVRWF